ncbi:hypothetical protein SGGMMB4_03954 [Sodalis glossinidius str. 'morsitans']|uniref:Uncharacterized protein n=1 Tax=Sodalis glossinidius (strain morsitans) TaxID=343509 RepID=A0A193QKZ8_SODGM|nr:helix-turn-helix domain-containing protein [Sodalis glossinidius]CRL45851.1 hypothetical protein SGGMMB4_03954 [Sodalis glossinidius str. 'morsitans']
MTQCRPREKLKRQVLDYIKANDGTNRLDLAAALHTDGSNISKVVRELIAEKYCRNNLVYRFDKLLLAVRKNDSQPNAKSM